MKAVVLERVTNCWSGTVVHGSAFYPTTKPRATTKRTVGTTETTSETSIAKRPSANDESLVSIVRHSKETSTANRCRRHEQHSILRWMESLGTRLALIVFIFFACHSWPTRGHLVNNPRTTNGRSIPFAVYAFSPPISSHFHHCSTSHVFLTSCSSLSNQERAEQPTFLATARIRVAAPRRRTKITTTTMTMNNNNIEGQSRGENWRIVTREALANEELQPQQLLGPSPSEWDPQVCQQSLDWYHHLMNLSTDSSNNSTSKTANDDPPKSTDLLQPHQIQQALHTIYDAYRLYGSGAVICSFNGGKDACVVLELQRATHAFYHSQQQEQQQPGGNVKIPRPRTVYWDKEGEFAQVLDFVQDTVKRYDLDMIVFAQGINFVEGLEFLVNHHTGGPLAFVLGTRQGDPNAQGQGSWEPSSATFMPPFMRVNPLLQQSPWDYGHVWQFLRQPASPQNQPLPICSLYEHGYTSLGTVHDTLPNPALEITNHDDEPKNDENEKRYQAAWELKDYSLERAGRISKTKADEKSSNDNNNDTKKTPARKSISTVSTESAAFVTPVEDEETAMKTTTTRTTIETTRTLENAETNVQSSVLGSSADGVVRVGLIVIGDEILKGYTVDTNSQAVANVVREYENVSLQRISVISDDLAVICHELDQYLKNSKVDVIITSGGIGPTHDDVTIKGIARALGYNLELNLEMAQLLWDKMGQKNNKNNEETNGQQQEEQQRQDVVDASQLSDAQIKMATLPRHSKLRYLSGKDNKKDAWPILQCHNIFILPGIPDYFVPKMTQVIHSLSAERRQEQEEEQQQQDSDGRMVRRSRSSSFKVVLSQDEFSIVPQLNQVVERHEGVVFGSYPFVNQTEYKTVITIEGGTKNNSNNALAEDRVQQALEDLIASLPDDCVVRVVADDMLMSSSSS